MMMSSPSPTSVEPEAPASWWQAADAPQPVGNYTSRFSPAVSLLAALFLIASLTSVVWLSSSIPKLERLESPERGLQLMVSRTMDVQRGLKRASPWEQQLFDWTTGDAASEQAQAIAWYRELASASDDSLVLLQSAILQAETGHIASAILTATEWTNAEPPLPRFKELILAAYGEGSTYDAASYGAMQAEAAEMLPAGWFYDRLAERLASRAGNASLVASIQAQAGLRADRQFARARVLTWVEISLLVLGTALLVCGWMNRRRASRLVRLHDPGVPPPWPGGVGAAVLLRGGAMGAILTALFLFYAPPDNASLRALAIPMTNVPLLLLAHHYLFRPSGMTFEEGFGLEIGWARAGRLMLAVLAVVAAGLWGEWVMDRVTETWQLDSHWAEWFDADLAWGSPALTTISLIEYVAFAPVFEEMAFRGLLFAILRRKFRLLPAALISASIFAVAHGYGLVGFISVLWSGVLWAWIYEKTGSLLPGILAHAINNLLVCLAVMALLR